MKQKRIVRLTESELNRVIRRCLNEATSDDEDNIDSLEYLLETIRNGNWDYVAKKISNFKTREVVELLLIVQKECPQQENGLINLIRRMD